MVREPICFFKLQLNCQYIAPPPEAYLRYRNLNLICIHTYVILKDYVVVLRGFFNMLEILNSVERKNKILEQLYNVNGDVLWVLN